MKNFGVLVVTEPLFCRVLWEVGYFTIFIYDGFPPPTSADFGFFETV
jgi:hypothetical protein